MVIKTLFRGIACGSLLSAAGAFAQDSATVDGVVEEIVVTGSLIRGTPEDAALPVEVYDMAELRASGSPTALEFAKSLTASGPTTGEAYYFSDAALTGNVLYNLRGIGADKTLTLFNGRRIAENSSIIPSIALQRIEVLKDGAAVTYGADATGGVVNFITRDDFEGFEAAATYKAIDDSDGDFGVELMGGFGGERTNVVWAAEWSHRSELDTVDRSFAHQPYGENPTPWSGLTNLARWFTHGTPPAVPTDEVSTSAPVGEYGTLLGVGVDFTQESCEAVGGVFATTSCNYGYIPYYNLVEENDIMRLFGQVSTAVTDNMEFYLRGAWSRVRTPYAYGSPSQPVVRGPSMVDGLVGQFYVPRANPAWDEFAARTGIVSSPFYPFMQGATAITYRAFAHGGNDVFAQGSSHSTPRDIDNRYWHVSTGFNGAFENGIGYDLGVTYNQTVTTSTNPDIIAYRLQEALNGFGGPACTAADLDPNRFGTQNPAAAGTGGCLWFNPFASNFAGQPVLGLANPNHVPGAENPDELVSWLFDRRAQEDLIDSITVDLVFNGEAPEAISLPGGPIAWGLGAQWRQLDSRETVPSPFYNGSQPCIWPSDQGQIPLSPDDPDHNGCSAPGPGPFQFFGTNPPDRNSLEQRSYFGELNFPLVDSLYMTAAVRHESFSGGLDATVYKFSGKWQATRNLAVRGSYGTNYQAPGIDVTPGEVVHGVNSYTVAGNAWLGATTVTRSDIEAETATVWSSGIIWQSRGFTEDSYFRFITDYFDIETEDELRLLATANDIASAVFAGGVSNCAHPLAHRVTFNGGACVNGSPANGAFAAITTDFGNGPSQHTAGFDIQASYGFPAFNGELDLGVTATRITKLEDTPAILDGFQLDDGDDRLGDLNFAVVGFAASKWRANFHANYAQGIHNVRLVANYVSGVDDERFINDDGSLDLARLTPAGFHPGTTTPFGPSDFGVKGDDWLSFDLHYNVELPWTTTMALSVVNIADEDPPESRQELGYDPRIGNPLGRTFEISFRKTLE
jgi:outer membrane receptor protein involved in Fe transport